MLRVRYSKYEGPAEEVDLDELFSHLQDFLLESGFNNNPFDPDPNEGRDYEDLLVAIAAALAVGELFVRVLFYVALDSAECRDTRLRELNSRLAQLLVEAGQ